ncbi:non-ribosomal peptide synthetase [Streptomyces neyagawaensis]|uniref:non-ribosomal peptide synthetase n=1 Tax=Streptomyces neyagawaensis TaxID=42238 RepID=UPI0006E413D6|nr:non-ribosomal peptide synthetase [Streptomyces neyagawaensis]MCL6733989.1 non-ribosomal peptide synthetase [Streptomyces neyagawaensis]MDE1682852.1 non-ribosomal peptide synthetase [Streptomyces neyagawaensis]
MSTTQDSAMQPKDSQDRRVDRSFPLSLAQERIWVSEQLADGGSHYGTPVVFALRGELDLGLLEAALTRIVERHEVLHSVVSNASGSPRFVVVPAHPVRLDPQDAASEQEIAEHVSAATAAPFDLLHGPLVRFGLYRLGPADHRLLVDIHHLVFDGVSAGVLVQELAELLAAGAEGRTPGLPVLPFAYGQYAVAQRRSLDEGLLDSQVEHWCTQLRDASFALELPTDYRRPARMSFHGASHSFTLPASLRDELAAAARRWSVTPYAVMLAGWAAVLGRYAGQEDLLVGTPMAGRTEPGTEEMIGMFVNVVPLRVRPERDQTFHGLVNQTRRASIEGLAHQEAPIEKVIERLRPPRDPSRNPLFQTAFVYDEGLEESIRVAGLTIEGAAPPPRTAAKLDLSIEVVEQDGRLEAEIEYATDLFAPETIRRIASHYTTFLANALRSPNRPLCEIPMASEEEHALLVRQQSGDGASFDPVVLPSLFEAQVARRPDACAVSCGALRWSYRQLNERANRLARALIARGMGPEKLVGVALPSGPLLVLAILAISKAGAAFLPLDPAYPTKRLEYIVGDARPALLLTDAAGATAQPWTTPILVLDEQQTGREADADASNVSDAQRSHPLTLAHPAYVIYTSGSTGTPKGVSVTHEGLAGLSGAQIEAFGVRSDSRVLQFASPSFDASVSELCMALLSGATAVFVPGLHDFVGGSFEAVLVRETVTHVTLPPSVLASLSPDEDLPADLTIVVAGESLTADLAARWSGRCSMFNAYGPTEATVCATLIGPLTGNEPPPIGRPIAGTQIFVLDEGLRPLPVGVAGELYLAGAGLARGYLGRPDLTAAGFVACPFGPAGGRMYRTGDRARWRDDGTLEFVGRRDDQIKMNGFRIELGEIENVIAAHPDVEQTAVVVREDRPGLRQVVAYVVAQAPNEEILVHAAAQLPGYMVPSAVVRLQNLPLTTSGKVDRRNLPAPDDRASVTDRGPGTAREQQLCKLIGEVLDLAEVGVDESFFELGGQSLHAVRLLSRIRSVMGVEIGIKTLFQAPTAALLAAQIDSGRIAVITRPALLPMVR